MRLIIAFLFIVVFSIRGSNAEEIRILAQPFPPFSIHGEHGATSGFSLELFKMIQEAMPDDVMADDQKYVAVTFNRMFVELQNGKRRVSVALGQNAKRLDKFKWAGPYVTINMGVIARTQSHISIKQIDDFEGYTIASIANAAAEQALMRQGVKEEQFERTPKPEQALQKLASGRVDMMTHAIQSTSYMIQELGLKQADFEKIYNIRELDLYFAFSQDFTDEEVNLFNTALGQVIKTNAYKDLVSKYHLKAFYQLR